MKTMIAYIQIITELMLLKGLFSLILNCGEVYLHYKYEMQMKIILRKLSFLMRKNRPNFLWSNIMITKYFITWLYRKPAKTTKLLPLLPLSREPHAMHINVQRAHWINIVKLFNCAAFLFAPYFLYSPQLVTCFREYFPFTKPLLYSFKYSMIVMIFQRKLFEACVLFSSTRQPVHSSTRPLLANGT